jgi:hypothetical protein
LAIDGKATDTELAAQANNGDQYALEQLILRHQAWIFNIDVRPHRAFPAAVAELGRSAARFGHIDRTEFGLSDRGTFTSWSVCRPMSGCGQGGGLARWESTEYGETG